MAESTKSQGSGEVQPSWVHRNFTLVNQVTGILAAMGFLAVVAVVFVGPRGLDASYIANHFLDVLSYMPVGLLVTALSFVMGLVIGFFVGWVRVSAAQAQMPPFRRHRTRAENLAFQELPGRVRARIRVEWIRWLLKQGAARVCYGYVELMRGTPVYVQIFFVWIVLIFRFPSLGLPTIAFYTGLIALTMNTGAYQGEIFRGGLQAVQQGQIEAARAVGLRYWSTMRHITLPQAVRLILPPLTNEFIGLLKASAFLYTVGLHEATAEGVFLTIRSLRVFEVFFMVTMSYLLITFPLAWAVKYMERRLRIPGLGFQEEIARGPRGPRASEPSSAAMSAATATGTEGPWWRLGIYTRGDAIRLFTGSRGAKRKLMAALSPSS